MMKINSSGLTYSRIPENTNAAREISQPKQGEVAPAQPSRNTEKTQSVFENRFSSPLSKHLSVEEKEMLNRLFPQNNESLSVHAYDQNRQAVDKPALRGQQLDITG